MKSNHETIDNELYTTSLWGPTCDGGDKILLNTKLPKLKLGDYICTANYGGYSCTGGTQFNGYGVWKTFYMYSTEDYDENSIFKNYLSGERSEDKN
jgi:ornithine decarboxylase